MARKNFKTKADRAFEEKLATALAPLGYIHHWNQGLSKCPECGNPLSPRGICQWELDDDHPAADMLLIRHWRPWDDEHFDYVADLFLMYGYYLELIDPVLELDADEVNVRLESM